VQLFIARIDPSSSTRSKVSVHLRAQKAQPKRTSIEALDAFDAVLRSADARLNDEHSGWRAEIASDNETEPLASAVSEYWRKKFEASEIASEEQQRLLAELERVVRENPSSADDEGKLAEGAVVIEDPKTFKAGLKVAEEPHPLVDWGDLPVPKL
jgi:insulysin